MEEPFFLSSENCLNSPYIFITGIGTEVGKTFITSKLCKKYNYDYWKPIQTGYNSTEKTDSETVSAFSPQTTIFPETYSFPKPISPHQEAKNNNIIISLQTIQNDFENVKSRSPKVLIEGAGGVLAPVSENLFIVDVILALELPVVVVTRNYLGSLNHTLLTDKFLKQRGINILAYAFNGGYSEDYISDLKKWLHLS